MWERRTGESLRKLCDLLESGVGSKGTSEMSHKQKNTPVVMFCEGYNPDENCGQRYVSKYVQTWIPNKTIEIQTELSCVKCEEYKVIVRQLQQRNSRLLGQKTHWKEKANSFVT